MLCSDGIERVQVGADATIKDLKEQIFKDLKVSVDDMTLSQDPRLVSDCVLVGI